MTPFRWLVRALSAGVWALGFSACGGSGDAGRADDRPCHGASAASCGTPCKLPADCAIGLYCGPDGACTAECSASGACPGSGVCGANGRCSAPPEGEGSGLFGRDGGPLGAGTPSCIDETVGFERLIPTVIVLVDRSGSMDAEFGGGLDRWESLRRTLIDPSTGILPAVQDRVRLGLTMYTSFDGNKGGVCPVLVEIPPAMNNVAAITAVYGSTEIVHHEDDTPTAEALQAVTATLVALKVAGPKAIVLATDGEPDTCGDADAHNSDTNARSVAAVAAAFQAGITTQVISVGTEVGEPHLRDLANAGVGGTGGTPYRVLDAKALTEAFDSIIRGVVSCEFQLDGKVEAGKEASGSVVLDAAALVYEDGNGWELAAPDRLRLKGDACRAVKETARTLHVQFPCGAYAKIR